ncbi:uncharacterized protein J4E87_005877 [Alternaria ethzedia]|uniref:uncharacterized protein n=1 Tax=Alternaria ethzedia TaxID=181014 RepID=UPI0020C50499|nr:uncharacterized protein J4E87_005877 [Alternaria ethzedia]KAI4622784.1 hypothetical protein J4E87_005877 [Alternaria ethzedia]
MRCLTLAIIVLQLALQHASATVGVLDIDDLLQPDLQQHLFAPSEDYPYAPWSHKPYCMTSSYLPTLGQKYCVYTSNTTGPHGLSLIFPPRSAHLASEYLDDNPLNNFLTQKDAERLYLGGQSWKIVDIPGKAKGVVATRKITMYETFMVDQAAVVVDMGAEKALNEAENKKLMKRAVDQLLVPAMIRDMSSAHAGENHEGGNDGDDEEEGSLEEAIMKTNAYGNLLLGIPFQKRQSLIKRWGFKCTCSLCSLPADERQASDLRRTMITQAEEKIMELAKAYKLDEAIALAEESVELIKDEGVWSMLTDEYAMLAMLWLEKGDKEKAEAYGEKTHRLLSDLGFLGIGEDREAWKLETLLKNIGGLGGMGQLWKTGPLRG